VILLQILPMVEVIVLMEMQVVLQKDTEALEMVKAA